VFLLLPWDCKIQYYYLFYCVQSRSQELLLLMAKEDRKDKLFLACCIVVEEEYGIRQYHSARIQNRLSPLARAFNRYLDFINDIQSCYYCEKTVHQKRPRYYTSQSTLTTTR